MRARLATGLAGAALLALAACDMPAPGAPSASAPSAPATADGTPSARSTALAVHYARVERDMRSRGLLRTDGGGPDTPWTDTVLLRNFEAIVFFDEYAPGAGFRPSTGRPVGLRKWTRPVRYGLEFGAAVPQEQRAADRDTVAGYAARLARASRHPITMAARDANFHVLVMTEDDRAAGLARVRQIAPDIDAATLGVFRNMPRSIHCLVVAFSGKGNPAFLRPRHRLGPRRTPRTHAQGLFPRGTGAGPRPRQ